MSRRSVSARSASRRSTWPRRTRRSRPAGSTRSRWRSARSAAPARRDGWAEDKDAELGQAEAPARDRGLGRCRGDARSWSRTSRAGPASALNIGRTAGGKTGTTENHADAWFCGITPTLSATVWVGYPQAEIPMTSVHGISVAGGTFPAEIWRLFMEEAIGSTPERDFPEAAVRSRSGTSSRAASTRVRFRRRTTTRPAAAPTTTTTQNRAARSASLRRRSRSPNRRHRRCRHRRSRSRRPSHRPPHRRLHLRPCPRCDSLRASPRSQRLSSCSPAPFPTAGSFGPSATGTSIFTAIYADRFLRGELPYRDVFVEYPPGAFAVFLPPAVLPAGAYNLAFKSLMALCGLAALFAVVLIFGRSACGDGRSVRGGRPLRGSRRSPSARSRSTPTTSSRPRYRRCARRDPAPARAARLRPPRRWP